MSEEYCAEIDFPRSILCTSDRFYSERFSFPLS